MRRVDVLVIMTLILIEPDFGLVVPTSCLSSGSVSKTYLVQLVETLNVRAVRIHIETLKGRDPG